MAAAVMRTIPLTIDNVLPDLRDGPADGLALTCGILEERLSLRPHGGHLSLNLGVQLAHLSILRAGLTDLPRYGFTFLE